MSQPASTLPTQRRLHGRAHWHDGEGIQECCTEPSKPSIKLEVPARLQIWFPDGEAIDIRAFLAELAVDLDSIRVPAGPMYHYERTGLKHFNARLTSDPRKKWRFENVNGRRVVKEIG